jgi:hypothetical protein
MSQREVPAGPLSVTQHDLLSLSFEDTWVQNGTTSSDLVGGLGVRSTERSQKAFSRAALCHEH